MRVLPGTRRGRRTAAVLAVAVAVFIADHRGWLLVRGRNDVAAYHGAMVDVVRVVDDGTLEIDRPDHLRGTPRTRVRLWGVTRASGGPASADGTTLARRWVGDRPVTLRLEAARTRGTFGCVLAHVERPDGSTLNETLLEAGLAVTDDRWPHRRLSAYARAENRARRAGRGRWAP